MEEGLFEARMPEILAFSDMHDFIDQQVVRYSAQQYQRLSFAAALMADPEIILSDDMLGVGDARYQQRGERLIAEKVDKDGVIFLFASNNLRRSGSCARGSSGCTTAEWRRTARAKR